MLHILWHYHSYQQLDKGFSALLRSLAFLPRGDMFVTPERFYDPDNKLLQVRTTESVIDSRVICSFLSQYKL